MTASELVPALESVLNKSMNWETMKKQMASKRDKFSEARKAMDQIYKDLIEAGWTMRDVDEADYHYLLHLLEKWRVAKNM